MKAIKESLKPMSFNEILGDYVIPSKLRSVLRTQLSSIGFKKIPYNLFAFVFYFAIFVSIGFVVYVNSIHLINFEVPLRVLICIIIFISSIFLFYFISFIFYKFFYYNLYYSRLKEIETHLPDFLTELNLHLRSGLILKKALENSTNEDFGFLNEIIKEINLEIKFGEEVPIAFKKTTKKYHSNHLTEALNLISKSDVEGGKTIFLIDKLIENINTYNYLRKETVASVGSYTFFITLLAVVISPALFAASVHVLILIKTMVNKIANSAMSSVMNGRGISPIVADIAKFKNFTLLATIITAFSAAIIMSIIKEGHAKKSFKYIVSYLFFSILSYFVFYLIIGTFFSNIIVN